MAEQNGNNLEAIAERVASQGAQINALTDMFRDFKAELHTIAERLSQPSDLSRRTAENVERLSQRVTAPKDIKGIVGLQLTGVLVIIAIGGVIAAGYSQRLAAIEADGLRVRAQILAEITSDNERERLDAYSMGVRDAKLADAQSDIEAIWARLELLRQMQGAP